MLLESWGVPEEHRVAYCAPRSRWGAGPWQDEPDRIEWRSPTLPGLALMAARGRAGAWCGYVGVPEGHPLFRVSASVADRLLMAHESLNFSESSQVDADHTGDFLLPRAEPWLVWWLGFDCAHLFQFAPAAEWMMTLARTLPWMPHALPSPTDHYVTVPEIRERVQELAGGIQGLALNAETLRRPE